VCVPKGKSSSSITVEELSNIFAPVLLRVPITSPLIGNTTETSMIPSNLTAGWLFTPPDSGEAENNESTREFHSMLEKRFVRLLLEVWIDLELHHQNNNNTVQKRASSNIEIYPVNSVKSPNKKLHKRRKKKYSNYSDGETENIQFPVPVPVG